MPKAVRYTHRQMVQGSLSMAHQMAEYSSPASLSGDDTLFPGIPMYHLLAWGTSVFAPYLGADLTFAGRFDPVQLARSIEADDATWTCLVPTMATQLLDTERDLFGSKLLVGGSVVTADLASRLRDAGIDFASIYGGTDMLAVGISIRTEHAREEGCSHVRRVTHPTPYVTVRVDEKSGNGVTDDATDSAAMGELLVRSPWLPDGYYDAPEGADEAYADGWFRTGDIGRRTEDGGIEVLDRITDAIKSGGEWIPSGVLESIVSEVDGVDAAAVLAKPDDEWGERPVAVVDADASVESELRRHLEVQVEVGRIEPWWVPEEVRFVDEFPLTSTGKIRKTELRDQVGL